MVTLIGIILADLIVVALFIYSHRQELGLTVNGSYDAPILRKKSRSVQAARTGAAGDQAKQGQIVPGAGTTGSGAARRGRRNAEIGAPRQTT